MTKLYRIEEESTNGWFTVPNHQGLTQEQCTEMYNGLMNDGVDPDRLRIIREQ